MNKDSWEVMQLCNLCDSINGLWKGKKEPFIKVGVIRNTNFTKDCKLDSINIEYLEVEEKQYSSRKLFFGDLILEKSGGGPKQPVGRIVPFEILEGDFSFSNFTSVLRIKDQRIIFYKFLYMFLLHFYRTGKTEKLQSNTTGIRNLDLKAYKSVSVPLPPLPIQKKIVKELDTLSDIITKKKEQLAELDKLAQAIFYNMFGDPVENEKKWPIKKLNDVCIKITDGTHNSPKNSQEGDFPYITAKNIRKDRIDLRDLTYISKEEHKIIFNRCNPEKGDLLYIKDGATTGIAQINTLDFEFSLLSSVALLKPDFKQINSFYFKYFLNNKKVYDSIRRNMGGAAITRLTIKKIQAIILLLPPLSIQTQFAEKIEAIEQQKALINQSLTDTQLLFDYTMDKYFN